MLLSFESRFSLGDEVYNHKDIIGEVIGLQVDMMVMKNLDVDYQITCKVETLSDEVFLIPEKDLHPLEYGKHKS